MVERMGVGITLKCCARARSVPCQTLYAQREFYSLSLSFSGTSLYDFIEIAQESFESSSDKIWWTRQLHLPKNKSRYFDREAFKR